MTIFDNLRSSPTVLDAKILSDLMGNGENTEAIESVLRASGGGDEYFVFAVERHEALAKAVGLPIHAVGYGYRYLSEGEIPEGIKHESIPRTGG